MEITKEAWVRGARRVGGGDVITIHDYAEVVEIRGTTAWVQALVRVTIDEATAQPDDCEGCGADRPPMDLSATSQGAWWVCAGCGHAHSVAEKRKGG